MQNKAMATKEQERARYILGDVRYAEHHRLPGWNIEPTVLQAPKLFKRVFPELTKANHIARAKKFQKKARTVEAQWDKNINSAVKLYGAHGAYISGAYREHFPETKKEVLRRLAHGSALLFKAAQAHWDAAGKRGPIEESPTGRSPARKRVNSKRSVRGAGRRDPGFKSCPVGTEVQSLILDQSHFDTRDAMGWAKRHGFRVSKVDTTAHSYRFRQKEPSTFVHDSFRTISMRPGVKAVIGCPK